MKRYLRDIWTSRHFWLHLARAELRARFRRSRLGILWALLQPLLLTSLIAFIFGTIFGHDMREFAPFVFSGILVWGFVCTAVTTGCGSLTGAASYIRQKKLPLAIYPLKSVISAFVVFNVGIVGLGIWVVAIKPGNLGFSWLSLIVSFPILFFLGWPLAVLAGLINTKFRDFQQFIGLILRAVWYMSPVFLKPKLFRDHNLSYLVDYNPVAHILRLIRAPMLEGSFPTLTDYAYALGTVAFVTAIAAYKIRREEPGLIFYL